MGANHHHSGPILDLSTPHSSSHPLLLHQRKIQSHASSSSKLWRNISIFVGLPCLIATGINAYLRFSHHQQHLAEHPIEYKEWPHLRIRKRPFPWGDGDKSFFHTESVNPSPP